ncbi:MAG TPA: hypothetical protein VHR45_11835 [Thermoanaerobaculia bacterium]|nr:hypothetical protein [Thermoanaerobaculia bacterium]
MSDSPYELQRLVTVETFTFPWEAQIAQARLLAEGIHSIIANEHLIRLVALSNAIGGIQVQVRERDHVAAAEVLRRRAPLPEIYLVTVPGSEGAEPSLRCPACAGGDLQAEASPRLVFGLLPLARRRLRCAGCGASWKLEELRGGGGRALGVAGVPSAGAAADGAPGDRSAEDGPRGAAEQAGDGAARADLRRALATVARFHTPWEAHLARTLLESEGIASCVFEERLPAISLLSTAALAHNRLEVHPADAALATEILARAWSSGGLAAVPDPDDPLPPE